MQKYSIQQQYAYRKNIIWFDISGRLEKIKSLVDAGKYFTINRARQYGKTTTLRALYRYLQKEYYVVLLDFQTFDNDKFENGNVFSAAFINSFLRSLKRNTLSPELEDAIKNILHSTDYTDKYFSLKELFEQLSDLCAAAEKKIVLMIDEVDSASNNQVFLDFLAQLRAQYIERDIQPTFRAVILAGVYDVKNLRRKIRPDEVHKYNSPWNIAADFKVDMSFSREEIAGMLDEYEKDYHTGMDVELLAGLIREYTSGYPFLVSRICQLLDEEISVKKEYGGKKSAWTKKGFLEAVRILLSEKNMLFESLREKLESYPELNSMLYSLLFTGKAIVYNYYETSINIATMFGFVGGYCKCNTDCDCHLMKNENGVLAVSNRIFETWLYNLYLSSAEMQKKGNLCGIVD